MARTKGSRDKNPRKKRGDSAPAANGAAPPRQAGIGDNSGLTDDQRLKLIMHHKGKYAEALNNKKKYDKDFKDVCKRAVADLGSDAVNDIKLMIEGGTDEGRKAIQSRIEAQLRVARWLTLPVGTQGDMLHQQPYSSHDRAIADGKMVGLAGGKCEPPAGLSPDDEQAWIGAWHDGQAQKVTDGIKPLEPQPPAPAGGGDAAFDDALEDAPAQEAAAPEAASQPVESATGESEANAQASGGDAIG